MFKVRSGPGLKKIFILKLDIKNKIFMLCILSNLASVYYMSNNADSWKIGAEMSWERISVVKDSIQRYLIPDWLPRAEILIGFQLKAGSYGAWEFKR